MSRDSTRQHTKPFRERVATLVLGSIAMFFVLMAFFGHNAHVPSTTFFNLGIACTGFALAAAPHALYERVDMQAFRRNAPVLSRAATVLMGTGNVFLVTAAALWLIG